MLSKQETLERSRNRIILYKAGYNIGLVEGFVNNIYSGVGMFGILLQSAKVLQTNVLGSAALEADGAPTKRQIYACIPKRH